MECKNSTFPLARYTYTPESGKFYYACGNTPAEDLLQCCVGVAEPSVLLLGSGDIRSCFYTLWKNFDLSISNAPRQFDGAHFVLDDCSSAILARNILFILLCLQLPEDTEERKKWLGALWAVWYCHELYPQHQKILDDSLKLLLKHSESYEDWSCASNPLHHLVRLTSPVVLAEISQVWKAWLEGSNVISVEQMHSSRQESLKVHKKYDKRDVEKFASRYAHDFVSVFGDKSDSKEKQITPEVILYMKSGNSYAESVLNTDLPTTSTTANVTLYESQDGTYTLFFNCIPFMSYNHNVEFSPGAMEDAGTEKHLCDAMLVQSESFKSHPLLANCVQQFFMWIQSSSAVLNSKKDAISFSFSNKDALVFCQEHSKVDSSQFDIIFSSNLIDYLGPNVVLSALPLLKLEGLLFTQTMFYYNCSMTSLDEFLNMSFGFDCKLFPVILGTRCINHEGVGYNSPVLIEPIPERTTLLSNSLIWQKVSAQPMVISKLPPLEPGSVTEGLVMSFTALTHSLLSKFTELADKALVCSNNIETAMLMLQTFMSSVDANSDYHFCEPLSTALKERLKPFLSGLQTQALLRKLHIHFTVDEGSCPICKDSPIEEYVGLFCAEVSMPEYRCNFMALIHPYSPLEVPGGQILDLLSSKDIQVIDCFDCTLQGNTVKLKFFAPMMFVARNFNITVAISIFGKKNSYTTLSTTSLQNTQVEFEHYNFSRATGLHPSSAILHNLVSNVYTQDNVVSEIALSDPMLEGLAVSDLSINKISSSEIRLLCGLQEFNLKFLFPVDYKRIKIKMSKVQRKVKVICPRHRHCFREEKPIYVVCPDHQLSLPPQHLKNEVLACHSDVQVLSEIKKTKEVPKDDIFQWESSTTINWGPSDFLFEAKKTLNIFFECKNAQVFHLTPSNHEGRMSGEIFVNKHLFDYQHHAPAVDLAFCFHEEHSYPVSVQSVKIGTCENVSVSDAAYEDLKNVFLYFAKRTNGDCKSAGVNSTYYNLVEQGVDKYFTRAVVYFLYNDPDRTLSSTGIISPLKELFSAYSAATKAVESQPKNRTCSFCNKSGILKTCKQCGEAQYCDKECQSKHWRRHKIECKKSVKAI